MDRPSQQVHFGAHDTGLEPPQLFEQPHAGRTMNRRDRERHAREAPVVEGDEARGNGGIVECRESRRVERLRVLLRYAGRRIERVERVEPERCQDREDALAAAAAERFASRHNGPGATSVAAVATDGVAIDGLAGDGRGGNHRGGVGIGGKGGAAARCRAFLRESASVRVRWSGDGGLFPALREKRPTAIGEGPRG